TRLPIEELQHRHRIASAQPLGFGHLFISLGSLAISQQARYPASARPATPEVFTPMCRYAPLFLVLLLLPAITLSLADSGKDKPTAARPTKAPPPGFAPLPAEGAGRAPEALPVPPRLPHRPRRRRAAPPLAGRPRLRRERPNVRRGVSRVQPVRQPEIAR